MFPKQTEILLQPFSSQPYCWIQDSVFYWTKTSLKTSCVSCHQTVKRSLCHDVVLCRSLPGSIFRLSVYFYFYFVYQCIFLAQTHEWVKHSKGETCFLILILEHMRIKPYLFLFVFKSFFRVRVLPPVLSLRVCEENNQKHLGAMLLTSGMEAI